MALEAASPSSSFTRGWNYDVFLSFRGPDTRTTFTGNLYNSLHQRGIRTFLDDKDLKIGEEITPSLVKAINESRIAIVVFSENYASSTFCLDELAKILEKIQGKDQLVWPIFYNVEPSEIRHLRGSFEDSFAKYKERFKDDKEKVLKWRLALRKAANLCGKHLKSGHEYEHEFIGRIVEEVSRKINHIPLHVANNPVGLQRPLLEVISLLELELDDRVKMVGIYGIGGIGKSTIAREVYNHIVDQFEGACFLDDVRENSIKHGLVQLQETLLSEAVGERNIKLGNVNKGIPVIMRRLQQKKILLVLDDVDKLNQLQMIAGRKDWFGYGSRVIITTRDKHLLARHGVDRVYEAKELNHEKSLELFSWNAFKNHEVDPNFLNLSNRFVLYAGGLPLALEVIGSNLFGKRIDEWHSALDKYKSMQTKEIHEILKVSYDGLDDEEKEVFLDIACCFKGNSLEIIKPVLDACGFHTIHSISELADKCLIKIDIFNRVTMHDLIQEMGKEIVRQESKKDVGQRSRLWFHDDIVHVLEGNKGSDKIEVLILDPPEEIEVHLEENDFEKMTNLRILIIRNARFSRSPKHLPNSLRVLDWRGCPSSALPCDFRGPQLVILKLEDICFQWNKPLQMFRSLRVMDIYNCDLRQIPDVSGVPTLKKLCICCCQNLNEIHDSVGFLKELEELRVIACNNLSIFPRAIKLPSLKLIEVSNCGSLRSFPEILEEIYNELKVDWMGTAIEELPSSILKLVGLTSLNLDRNASLNLVPFGILMLPRLGRFTAQSCRRFHFSQSIEGHEQVEPSSTRPSNRRSINLKNCGLKDEFLVFPISWLYHVIDLDLSHNSFTVLPASFKQCRSLRILRLNSCKQLREIKGLPPTISVVDASHCTSLSLQSISMLLSQVLLRTNRRFALPGDDYFLIGERKFVLPGERKVVLPVKGFRTPLINIDAETGMFWFRKKIPPMTVCFIEKDCVVPLPTRTFQMRKNHKVLVPLPLPDNCAISKHPCMFY